MRNERPPHRLRVDLLVPAVPARGGARGAARTRSAWWCSRSASRSGLGGIVSDGVRKSLSGIQLNGYTVIAGLGGRAITRASLRRLFEDAERDELEQVTFLDLNAEVVSSSSSARRAARRTRPHRRSASCGGIGTVASGIG